ncbi:ABC transporter substrate-binding protein [Enterococcus sp. CWB-B31]|uniref:ABC transporter substrate-binding protein n=1 Tax=Enterococcus sp. CWB-B31 TaxID=2885159 RepID=UPI001E5EF360|nr:ABC transporter substrate-binding protein [Enterococcus sp. CWB-B31]MCB5955556.1 ABC transporter substrate-binding protein [Enterococcus sp. CWB-B31]
MKKLSVIGVIMILFSLVLTGCNGTNKESSNENNQEAETVNIAISDEPKAEQLDATTYNSSMAIYSAVYEPLVEYDEKGAFKPGLAASWEISEDGKKYIFYLNEKVKFSDGSPVDAEAVKFTIERAKFNNEISSLQLLSNLEKIEVIDEQTIELTFTEISNQILAELCQTRPLRIMSPHSVEEEKVSGKFIEAIGSGAFMIKESSAEHVLMIPNPYYNDENPVNYQINFKMIEDGSSRTLALKSGEADIIGGTLGAVTDSDIGSFESDTEYNVVEFEGTMSHFLAFNPDNQELNTTLRNVIELAIDKASLSDKELVGLFRENVQYVSEVNQKAVTYDIEKAMSILESEGYAKNKAGYYEKDHQELSFDLVIQTTEFPEWKQQAELLENDLKKAGIKINITILDREGYYDALWKTKEYDLIFYRTYTDALLPYNFLNSLYHNTEEEHGVLANDEVLSQLLDEFGQVIDEQQKQQIADKLFKRISDETLAIPIDYKDEKFVVSDKISEFSYSGLSDSPIDYKNLMVK